jgi:uncharacterized protein with GYD domain
MAKYLFEGRYTLEGVRGLKAEGGAKREAAAAAAVKSVGGKIESFYFTFGGNDVILIVDLPNNAAAAGLALAFGAGGGISVKTSVLLTPEEIDTAVGKKVSYRAPGA